MTTTSTDTIRPKDLEGRLADCADRGVDAIKDRLCELDQEWTAGRMVKAIAGVAVVTGFVLAALVDPIWLLLPAVAGVFLLQYLFFCRSFLTDLFVACGYRTGHAIDEERLLLRTLRGDFRHLPTMAEVEDKDAVSRMEGEGGPPLEVEAEVRLAPKEAAAVLASAVQ